jgi:hypothetical protein
VKTSFNYRIDCPICHGARKDCRESSTGLIHCLSGENPPPGWRFLGQDRIGFGLYGQGDRLDSTDLERYKAEREQARAERLEAARATLPNNDRDRHYRRIARAQGLSLSHRANLKQRGLTPGEIDFLAAQGWLSSWEPGQEAWGNSPALAGVNPQTGKLCGVAGIAIYAQLDGCSVGAQIGADDREKFGKYIWLSSNSKGGNSPQLQNGENPLFIWQNPDFDPAQPATIHLCEGALKSLIAAVKSWRGGDTQTVWIGAAGGLFKGLAGILEAIPNIAKATLYPDAGAIANPQILRNYEGAIAQISGEFGECTIAWWGQVDKSHSDIDELQDWSTIQRLTVSKFKEIGIAERERQRRTDGRISFDFDPIKEAERDQQRQSRDCYRAETEQIQGELNSLRIEPTIAASGRYISSGLLQLPEKSGIVLIDGTMGAGKTSTSLREIVEQHRQAHPGALQWLFAPRNLLGLQSGRLLNLPHHTLSSGTPFQGSSCFESVGVIPLDRLPDSPPLILIDEASQAFKQILDGNTCKDYQPFVIERIRQLFKAVANRGGWIVPSEDGLTNLELDFVQDACGLEVSEFLQFTKTITTPREYTLFDKPAQTWAEIERRLAAGENLAIASDARSWLEETGRWLEGLGIEPDLIHSGNSREPWVHQVAENPRAWVEANRPRVFGYSPTFGEGVSIEDPTGHFGSVALHFTHLEPRSAKQMGDRLRSDVPRFGYVKERAATANELYSNCRPDLILRDLKRNIEGVQKVTAFADYAAQNTDVDLLAEVERLRGDWDNPDTNLGFYLKYWSRYKARETFNKLSLREGLIDIWQAQGHSVTVVEPGNLKELTEQRRESRKQLDTEEAIAWVEADSSKLSNQDARDILDRLGSSEDERRAARKRLIEDKLPGAPLDSPEFVLKAIVKDKGRFLKTTELLWLAKNPEAAKQLDQWTLKNTFTQSAKTGRFVIAHRLPVRSAQAKLLNDCPLQPFIDGVITTWHNLTPEVIAACEWVLLHRRPLARYLRLTIKEEHTPVQTVNKILRKLGLEVVDTGHWYGRNQKNKGERIYTIANLNDCDRDAILKALTERFASRAQAVDSSPAIATRIFNPPPTSCDRTLSPWLTFESLEDVKNWWALADSEEVRAEIKKLVPPKILERAIA